MFLIFVYPVFVLEKYCFTLYYNYLKVSNTTFIIPYTLIMHALNEWWHVTYLSRMPLVQLSGWWRETHLVWVHFESPHPLCTSDQGVTNWGTEEAHKRIALQQTNHDTETSSSVLKECPLVVERVNTQSYSMCTTSTAPFSDRMLQVCTTDWNSGASVLRWRKWRTWPEGMFSGAHVEHSSASLTSSWRQQRHVHPAGCCMTSCLNQPAQPHLSGRHINHLQLLHPPRSWK